MPGPGGLEPLQRAHRRGALAAEQQVEERNQQADTEALEQHHEEGAREDRGEHHPPLDEVRPEEPKDIPELGDLLDPGLHDWRLGYPIDRRQRVGPLANAVGFTVGLRNGVRAARRVAPASWGCRSAPPPPRRARRRRAAGRRARCGDP